MSKELDSKESGSVLSPVHLQSWDMKGKKRRRGKISVPETSFCVEIWRSIQKIMGLCVKVIDTTLKGQSAKSELIYRSK